MHFLKTPNIYAFSKQDQDIVLIRNPFTDYICANKTLLLPDGGIFSQN